MHRREHKPQHGVYSQTKRREEALARIREQKRKQQDDIRKAHLESFEQTSQVLCLSCENASECRLETMEFR